MSDPIRGWREQDLDHIKKHLIKEGEEGIKLKEKIGKTQWQLYASDTMERALDSSAYSSYVIDTDEKGLSSGTTSASSTPTPTLTRVASSSQISARHFFSDVPSTRSTSYSQDSGRVISSAPTPSQTSTSTALALEDRFSEFELMQQKCLYQHFINCIFSQLYKFEVIPSFYTREIIELVYITQLSTRADKDKQEPGSQEYFLARHYSAADATYLNKKFVRAYATQFSSPKPTAGEAGHKVSIAKTVMENFKDQQLVHKIAQRTSEDFYGRFFKIIGKLEDYKIQQALNKAHVAGRVLHPAEDQRKEEARLASLEGQGSDPLSPNIPKVPKSPPVAKSASPESQGIESPNIPPKVPIARSTSGEPTASFKGHVRSPTDHRLSQRSQTPVHFIQTIDSSLRSPTGQNQTARSQTPTQPFVSPTGLRIHRDPNVPAVIPVN